jgi:hypothetical protein
LLQMPLRSFLVVWFERLRNPSAAVDGFRKSSTHPTAAAGATFYHNSQQR